MDIATEMVLMCPYSPEFPYWRPYGTDKFISCVVPGPSQWFSHFGEETVMEWAWVKMTTLGDTEPRHSSWQCKESHRCFPGLRALLTMRDSGTSTVLTRHESMRLRSLRQSERTTERNPVQHKRCTFQCYRAVNTDINKDGRADGVQRLPNIWKNVINKRGDYMEAT